MQLSGVLSVLNLALTFSLLELFIVFSQAHECHYALDSVWLADAGSAPIVSSPLIADVNGDNVKDVTATTFDGQLSVIDGRNGQSLPGWPLVVVDASFHAAPSLYDFDKDGLMEVMVSTSDGRIVFVQLDGTIMPGQTLQVPPLKLKRDWFKIDMDQIQQMGNKLSIGNPRENGHITHVKEFIIEETGKEDQTLSSVYQPGRRPSGLSPDTKWVYVDPHVLSTPVITDFNQDGLQNELVVPVNFYFDHESISTTLTGLSREDAENYLGCGLVVYNLDTGYIVYQTVLEVTKRSSLYPGYLLSSPTIVDNSSVVVGTSTGSIYLIKSSAPDPVTLTSMDSIQGQVSVVDVNDDGAVEVIAIDDSGNVACVDLTGKLVWESRVSGSTASGIRIADINGDGLLDVVFATYDGYLWVLNGDTGKVLPGWPVKLPGELRATVMATKLQPGHGLGLDLVVPLLDGSLAIVRGRDHCTELIKTGVDSLAAAVTADLLPWKQGMELIVGGTEGTLLCLGQTANTSDHSITGIAVRMDLFSWPAETAPCTGTTFYSGKVGVSITKSSRMLTHFTGSVFPLEFEITDMQPKDLRWNNYRTKVFFGNKQLAVNKTFARPGVFTEQLDVPAEPSRAVIVIRVITPNNQCFQDSMHVSFNTHYLEDLHWYLLAPVITMACLLLVLHGNAPAADILPTTTR